jgi:hypothetical protein
MGISSKTAHVLLDIKIITDTYVHTVKMKVKKYFREKRENNCSQRITCIVTKPTYAKTNQIT